MSGMGEFTRKLAVCCASYGCTDRARALTDAFEQTRLPVALIQVQHILELLKQCAGSDTLPEWGQLCLAAAEILTSSFLSKGKGGVVKDPNFNCEVFLGGSCNPTTWRKDVAIPTLEKACVTYYNPQRDDWSPELVAIEEKAKQSADILLFVLDNQTRAVASMIEVAYLAGIGRDVVSVILDVNNSTTIAGEKLSPREVDDLNRGRAFVKSILEVSSNSIIQSDLPTALNTIAQLRKTKESVSAYNTRLGKNKSSYRDSVTTSLANKIHIIEKACRKGTVSIEKLQDTLRQLNIDTTLLSRYLLSHEIQDRVLLWKQNGVSTDDLCSLYCELMFCSHHDNLATLAGISGDQSLCPPPGPTMLYDVFLGGSCGHTSWRTEIATPLLGQRNMSYYNPQIPGWNLECIPVEREAKELSQVILIVITGQTLSVASMVEASSYIGCGRKVVLCMEDIPTTGTPLVEGIQLSERAVKDYNRARTYLRAIAANAGTPLFADITEATRHASELARDHTPSSIR